MRLKRKAKRKENTQPPIKGVDSRLSIQDRIKIFSGELIRRQLENKIIPGRLKIPEIFLQGEKADKSKKEEDKKKKIKNEYLEFVK